VITVMSRRRVRKFGEQSGWFLRSRCRDRRRPRGVSPAYVMDRRRTVSSLAPQRGASSVTQRRSEKIPPNTTAAGRKLNRRVEMIVSGEVIGTQIGSPAGGAASPAAPATNTPMQQPLQPQKWRFRPRFVRKMQSSSRHTEKTASISASCLLRSQWPDP
jgi:hypothetical protein